MENIDTSCVLCNGSGYKSSRRWLNRLVGYILDAGATSVQDGPVHPLLRSLADKPGERPSADLEELTTKLTRRGPDGILGYDSMDRWEATKKIIASAGLDPNIWGMCDECHGSGERAMQQ